LYIADFDKQWYKRLKYEEAEQRTMKTEPENERTDGEDKRIEHQKTEGWMEKILLRLRD
jgi:hypothetical protein